MNVTKKVDFKFPSQQRELLYYYESVNILTL
jgi:hypothetical protein